MTMSYDPLAYEMPWRPNYEKNAVAGWLAASGAALAVEQVSTMPPEPFYWMTGICGVMAMARLPKAIKLHLLQKHLKGRDLEFISIAELQKYIKDTPDDMWLGSGFLWENRHAQRVFEILKRDWTSIVGRESTVKKVVRKIQGKKKELPIGQPWIHGVEPKEEKLMQPLKHTEGHSLIVGTTGSGKTRMFDILISQAILRGEAVIIIDPKGDKEMRDNARRACEAMGQPERFVSFHPAFPEESVRIDPLRNFTRVTEIASRLAALIPSEAGADPFKSFGWQALNNIAQGLVITHDRPNLTKLRRFLEGGAAGLVIKAVQAYSERVMPDWEAEAAAYLEKVKNGSREKIAFALMKFYYDIIQPEHPNSDLEGLLSMFQHDQTHFSKMVANLLPIMNMLTSGELGPLLSPDSSDLSDERQITDSAKIINNAQVAYLGLDSLTDNMVGSAMGSIFLSDLTAVAGDRYNYGVNNRPVNIFVDEAAEVINDPFIQLLNKGRGAKLRLFVATQTFADFAARLGSKDKALQVLGNINNTFALRIRPAFLTVLRGGAIGAGVEARKLSGEAPFTAVFKLSLDDRQDLRATGQVVWETSKDDGKTWEQFIPEDRYKYQLVKTFDKGEYQVRAKVVNVNSGAEKYTEAVSVVAYDKPDIAVIGPTTLFVGSEGKYTANLTLNDEPISGGNAIVEWSTDGGKTYAQTGDSITLSSDEETRYRLWARVRSATAPADDGYAYEVAKTAVDFRAVKAPRPYVTGPRVIETGKKYVFKAETSLPYRGMDVKLNGFFTLPDGSIVQGDTAEYEPSDTDLNQATVETKYTTWIEGYRDQGAEASHSLRSRVWQYVWPSFGMQVRKNADVAPATITASVRPIAFNGKLEEPTYEWELPEGAVIQDQRQDIVRSFVINEPGDYNIKVTVRDARGHETVIEQPLKIGQAAPYAIDLQYSGSNKYEREPLDVLLRPYISGGHPRDRISTRVYSVDGTPLESSGYYGRATLGAGEHSIKLKITSEMGHEAEGEVNINVAENKLPACSLSSRETVGSWIVYANCEDTDGRMKSYEWTIAGELQSISSDRVTISKGTYETMPTISLVGVDDSGGKSEAVTMN